MQDISPEALHLVQEGAPHFFQAVQRVVTAHPRPAETPPLLSTLETFYDDPILLYAALWYAYTQGVPVTLLPKEVSRAVRRRTDAQGEHDQSEEASHSA